MSDALAALEARVAEVERAVGIRREAPMAERAREAAPDVSSAPAPALRSASRSAPRSAPVSAPVAAAVAAPVSAPEG